MSRLPARRRSPSPSRARWRSVNSDSIREGVVGADVNHAVLPAGNAARSTVTTANLDSTDSEFLILNSKTGQNMKTLVYVTSAALCCGGVWSSGALPAGSSFRALSVSAQASRGAVTDWLTDGGDNQRTGWQRNETILTKKNVKNLKILWKIQTGNQVRALHSLMTVLIVGRLNTSNGAREVGIVNGISDNLYAFDVESGTILWQKHWAYTSPTAAGGPPASSNPDPAHLGFLRPGGSSDTPVIGPADAQGRRPVYFVTGDGVLHILNAANGTDLEPPYMFHIGKGWSLNLVGNVLWMANTYAGISIAAVRMDDPRHKVMTFNAGSGGAWGRRGAAIDSTGTAWFTTGDGIYDVTSDPPRYGNSVVGVHMVGDELKLKSYFAPKNWAWLQKRDLDPNNTPTVFTYKGRELIAASGK